MPRVTRIPLADQPVMAWANGGGSTRQVAIDPPTGSLAKGFRWRVSIAQVASDGPFSVLPGIDRSLWLLRGAGVQLTVDGATIDLTRPLQRFDFAGETQVTSRLVAGPCEDLNVMVARNLVRAQATLADIPAGSVLDLPATEQRLVVVLSGRLATPDGALVAIERDALRCEEHCELELQTGEAPCTALVCSFCRTP
ncbi:MAG TPA: HutD family protein [Planctomycetota bacterium]|nr:HutD family protein [Planctomycetota bacterium]